MIMEQHLYQDGHRGRKEPPPDKHADTRDSASRL